MTTSKKLEINKAALTATLPKDHSDYTVAGLVSIPWTSSVPVRVNFTATGDQPVKITVCE
jgi:hypothetical protein